MQFQIYDGVDCKTGFNSLQLSFTTVYTISKQHLFVFDNVITLQIDVTIIKCTVDRK